MKPSPWPDLGIPATTDQGAIRRAYAARLKTLDVDGDPAAFMRLRSAYEAALFASRATFDSFDNSDDFGGSDDFDDLETAPTPSLGPPQALPPETSDDAPEWQASGPAFTRFCIAFEAALGAGNTGEAGKALRMAMAQGTLPLGLEEDYAARFLASARDDAALSPEALAETVAMFGVAAEHCGYSRLAPLFDDIRARIEALRWFAAINATAARGDDAGIGGLLRRSFYPRIRAARALRAGRAHKLRKRDLTPARGQLNAALLHAPWLGERLDLARFEAELGERERHFQPSLLRPLLCLSLMIAAGVVANAGGNEIFGLTLFALALISIGGWILPLIGFAFLVMIGQLCLLP